MSLPAGFVQIDLFASAAEPAPKPKPKRTDTSYWHEYVMRAAEIRFVRGRLKFGGVKDNAPFPSAVVVFKPGQHELKISSMEV